MGEKGRKIRKEEEVSRVGYGFLICEDQGLGLERFGLVERERERGGVAHCAEILVCTDILDKGVSSNIMSYEGKMGRIWKMKQG